MLPSDLDELIGGALGDSVYELLRQRLVKEILVANPSVGGDWSQTVPAGVTWEILTLQEVLTTSAVVANRQAGVAWADPNGVRAGRVSPAGSVPASSATQESFIAGLGAALAIAHHQNPLPTPPLILPSAWTLGSVTGNLDVGDQYSGIVLTVREWSINAVQVNLDQIAKTIR